MLVFAAYVAVVAAAFASGRAWLDEVATFMVVTLVLWPGLRRLNPPAIALWLASACGIAALAFAGDGDVALDFLPVIINLALCVLFARTLKPGSEPLIARLIAVIESPARVALPRVAGYARALTWVWAIVLGAQALLLTALIVCAVPGGLLARLRIASPFAIAADDWRWFLIFGSYATVLALLVLEYAFRRWYLRHIAHVSLPVFMSRLVRRWPALAASVMHDPHEEARA
jgi:anaerobic C4-dicarboxylate transporter